MNYLKELLKANSGASSKRFISLYSLLLLTLIIAFELLGYVVRIDIIYTLAGLITGSSLMTLTHTINTTKNKNINKDESNEASFK